MQALELLNLKLHLVGLMVIKEVVEVQTEDQEMHPIDMDQQELLIIQEYIEEGIHLHLLGLVLTDPRRERMQILEIIFQKQIMLEEVYPQTFWEVLIPLINKII